MQRLQFVFWTCLLSASLLHSQQKAGLPLTITISPASLTVKAGEEVYVKVQMTNVSSQPVDCSSYYVNGTDRRFRVDVLDENGASTKKSSEHPESMPGSLQQCTLDPGQSTPPKEDLISSFHDFSRPGKYRVRFSRVIDGDEKKGLASSNTITVTVMP